MTIIISGICGFVGSTIASRLLEQKPSTKIIGFDNFSRPGSHTNKDKLEKLGIKVLHADVRQVSDMESLPKAEWIVDAAANASVLAGVDGTASSRQLIENNLYGTVNLLEYAKRHRAGFILLSTSRVYSIGALKALPLDVKNGAFELQRRADLPEGMSERGIAENFATTAPVSLYGSSKLCSELLALEYCEAFNVPVWINRCGALAGAGQFGRPDQGIFTYWINSYLRKKPLQYIGFAGSGHQVRDCFHPNDLASLIEKQMGSISSEVNRLFNLGGGADNTMSLLNLTAWCQKRFGNHEISKNSDERTFDVPWVVLDSGSAHSKWDWQPTIKLEAILEEIAVHAEAHPNWLEICAQGK